MTLRELFREFVAARERWEAEHDRDVTQAWHTARIYLTARANKKFPALADQMVTGRKAGKHQQTAKQMRSALETLSRQYGIPLRRRTKA